MQSKKEKSNIGNTISNAVEDDDSSLDELIDKVARGQAIVLFPPGIFIFVFTMMLLPMFSTVPLIAESLKWLGPELTNPETAFGVFGSIFICAFFTITPFFLIAHGKKKYVEVTRYYYRFLFWTSSIFLALYGATHTELNIPFLLANIISALGLWLMKTLSYQQFVEYMHLLKKRKLEIYEEEQKSKLGDQAH